MRLSLAAALFALSLLGSGAPPVLAEPGAYTLRASEASTPLRFPSGVTVSRAKDETSDTRYRRFEITSDGSIFAAKTITRSYRADAVLADVVAEEFDVRSLAVTRKLDYRTLVEQGSLRPVTKAERREWESAFLTRSVAQAARHDKKTSLIWRATPQSPHMMLTRPIGGDALIVNKTKRLTLFLPKGMPLDRVPQGADGLYSMASGTCIGKGTVCESQWEQSTTASSACFSGLPDQMHVQGLAIFGPSNSRATLVGLGEKPAGGVGQIDVYVAPSPDPMFLTLGSEKSAIWALKLAPETRLAGVLVRGKGSQAVSGVPDGVPVRFATRADGVDPGCGSWASDPFYSGKIEQWGRDLKAMTGRSFDAFHSDRTPTHLLIGEWPGIAASKQDFIGNPIYGEAGETPQLPLDPLDQLIASAPASDLSFTVQNPKVFGLIFAAVCGVYLFFRRKVVRKFRGDGKKKPGRSRHVWAYLRGMFAGIATFSALLISAAGMGGMGMQGGFLFLILTPVFGALFYLPFRATIRFLEGQGVRRGFSDIGAPAIVAGLACIAIAKSGMIPFGDGGVSLKYLSFSVLGGAMMGWQYWRSLGYPGAREGVAEVAQRAMDAVEDSSGAALLNTTKELRRVASKTIKPRTPRKPRAAPEPPEDAFMMRKKRGKPVAP